MLGGPVDAGAGHRPLARSATRLIRCCRRRAASSPASAEPGPGRSAACASSLRGEPLGRILPRSIARRGSPPQVVTATQSRKLFARRVTSGFSASPWMAAVEPLSRRTCHDGRVLEPPLDRHRPVELARVGGPGDDVEEVAEDLGRVGLTSPPGSPRTPACIIAIWCSALSAVGHLGVERVDAGASDRAGSRSSATSPRPSASRSCRCPRARSRRRGCTRGPSWAG